MRNAAGPAPGAAVERPGTWALQPVAASSGAAMTAAGPPPPAAARGGAAAADGGASGGANAGASDSPSSSGDVSAADTLLVSIPGALPGDSDVRVSVVCNGLAGVLLLPKKRVIVNPGSDAAREVSPTEFERLAGKGGAKKWRQTIHLRNGKGPIGEWLVAHGFDPQPSRGAAPAAAPPPAPAAEVLTCSSIFCRGQCGGAGCGSLPPAVLDKAAAVMEVRQLAALQEREQQQRAQRRAAAADGRLLLAAQQQQLVPLLSRHQQMRVNGPHGPLTYSYEPMQDPDLGLGGEHNPHYWPAPSVTPPPGPLPQLQPQAHHHAPPPGQQAQHAQHGQHGAQWAPAGQQLLAQQHHHHSAPLQRPSPRASIFHTAAAAAAAAAAGGAAPAGGARGGGAPASPARGAPLRGAASMPLLPLPVADLRPLPGDGSEAVAIMADYLCGLAPAPPIHLLQTAQLPTIAGRPVELRALFNAVVSRGGYRAVAAGARWQEVVAALGLDGAAAGGGPGALEAACRAVGGAYVELLLRFERMFDTEAWHMLTGRPSPVLGIASAAMQPPLAPAGSGSLSQPHATHASGTGNATEASPRDRPARGASPGPSPSAGSSGGPPVSASAPNLAALQGAGADERPAKRRSTRDADPRGGMASGGSFCCAAPAAGQYPGGVLPRTNSMPADPLSQTQLLAQRQALLLRARQRALQQQQQQLQHEQRQLQHEQQQLQQQGLAEPFDSGANLGYGLCAMDATAMDSGPLSHGATNGALYADCHEELGSFDLVARYPSAPCLSLPPGRGLAPLLAARQPLARPQPQRRPSAAAPAAGGMPAQSAVFESAAFESAAFESEPGHEPIGSRQGLAPRHGAGRGPPPAAPAAPQAPHPQAVVPPPWPGADALADLAQAEGMDVSELLDGFPNELDLLALEPDHSEH